MRVARATARVKVGASAGREQVAGCRRRGQHQAADCQSASMLSSKVREKRGDDAIIPMRTAGASAPNALLLTCG